MKDADRLKLTRCKSTGRGLFLVAVEYRGNGVYCHDRVKLHNAADREQVFTGSANTARLKGDADLLAEVRADLEQQLLNHTKMPPRSGAPSTNGAMAAGTSGAKPNPAPPPVPPWPQLDGAAMIGPAGELVKAIEPHTEADPVGILFQVLVGFGSIIGRLAFFRVEETPHYGNEYVVLVGDTATGRKGTSWNHALRALSVADADWARDRIKHGLSSAEGLIDQVRDPLKGDEGVTDKRLLVQEGEFANALKQSERKGNTLSETLRQAWDGAPLGSLVRNSPARCCEPHVSIIGHITPGDLHRHLTAGDATNGLGNRFLFVCVKRSKELPLGGNPDRDRLNSCGKEIGVAATEAKHFSQIEFDDAARIMWCAEYSGLTAERPGKVGSLSGRAPRLPARDALRAARPRDPHLAVSPEGRSRVLELLRGVAAARLR